MIEGFCEGNQLPMISSEFLAYDDRCYMLYCTKGGGGGMGVLQTCCHHMMLGHRGGGIFGLCGDQARMY